MKTLLGLLSGLALVSLSACTSSPPGERCSGIDGTWWEGRTVTCGGDTFEIVDDYVAWRDIPESEPCPGTTCDDIEIVTRQDCPEVDIGELRMKGGGSPPDARRLQLENVEGAVRYTLQSIDSRVRVSALVRAIDCWYPD